MLEVQRQRGISHQEEIDFTRKFMWSHMILGAAVIAVFLFHELFAWFAGSLCWYSLTLAVMYGFMNEQKSCRWLLALVFLAAVGAGVYFINFVFPNTSPPRGELIPHAFIPIWVGMVNLAYGVGAFMLLFHPKINRAGKAGFTLW